MLKMTQSNGTIWKSDLICLIACMLICLAGSMPFIMNRELQLLLAITFGVFLSKALRKWKNNRLMLHKLEQFRWLLEHLLTRMTAGATFERALIDAAEALKPILGNKAKLYNGLKQVEMQLLAHQPLVRVLSQLSHNLGSTEAKIFFQVLPDLLKSGGQIIQFIRQQIQIVSRTIALQQDINAENTQKQTEAVIMAILPFGMAGLLNSMSYQPQQAKNQFFEIVGSTSAYILAMIAAISSLSILANKMGFTNKQASLRLNYHVTKKKLVKLMKFPAQMLLNFYQSGLPTFYGVRLLQHLLEISGENRQTDKQVWLVFFIRKTCLVLTGLFPITILLSIRSEYWYWAFLLPIIICLLQDQQVFICARNRLMVSRVDYPTFLNLTAALLYAGLSLHKSLTIALHALIISSNKNVSPAALQQDLSSIRNQMQIGLPADKILEKLSGSCGLPEAQAAMLLMVRYDRTGASDVLQLLQMQASTCWSLQQSAIRKQLELQYMKLLLPMTLDLTAIIITAILPAISSLLTI